MNWILLIAAIVISFLVFTWLIRVVKATIGTAIAIAVLILLLQIFFGIGFDEVWQQIKSLWSGLVSGQ